jgi:hypothetical protein
VTPSPRRSEGPGTLDDVWLATDDLGLSYHSGSAGGGGGVQVSVSRRWFHPPLQPEASAVTFTLLEDGAETAAVTVDLGPPA